MTAFWHLTLRRGRKQHRCEPCGRIIPAGEPSYAVAGVFQGDFTSYRECIPCEQLIRRLYALGELDPDGFFFDHLPEIARDVEEAWPPEFNPAQVFAGWVSQIAQIARWTK